MSVLSIVMAHQARALPEGGAKPEMELPDVETARARLAAARRRLRVMCVPALAIAAAALASAWMPWRSFDASLGAGGTRVYRNAAQLSVAAIPMRVAVVVALCALVAQSRAWLVTPLLGYPLLKAASTQMTDAAGAWLEVSRWREMASGYRTAQVAVMAAMCLCALLGIQAAVVARRRRQLRRAGEAHSDGVLVRLADQSLETYMARRTASRAKSPAA